MALLPRYRGVRVRPYMRYLRFILFGILFVIGALPIAYYGYMMKEELMNGNIFSITIFSSITIVWLLFSFMLSLILIEQTVMFAKWDRYARLARFLFENRYIYEKKTANGTSVKFPRIYLKQNKFDLEVAFELAGSKFQQKFKEIGGDLETTFAMDFMEAEDDERFKTFKLAYSALLNRIKISEVTFSYERGVCLMKNFFWDFLSDPHLLVSGGTGGGKTVFLRALILCLAKIGVVDICDPKRADFVTTADVLAFKGRVFFEMTDIVDRFEEAERIMMERYDKMRAEAEKAGDKDMKKFYEYGLEPYFLVCDEYNSLVNSLSYKDRERLERALIKLSLLGRQSGVNIILAMQKPTAEDIPTKVRDNMNMRICVGRLSDLGYNMMFGEPNRNKDFKFMKYVGGMRVFGRGYSAVNGEVAREFYSPLLEKSFSFYEEFEKLERHELGFNIDSGNVEAEVEPEIASDEEELFSSGKTLLDFSASVEQPIQTVKRLVTLVEATGKWTFNRDKEVISLSFDDEMVLVSLIAKKEEDSTSWKEVVEAFDYGNV